MLFMNTPYWQSVEREMQTIPNFKPRGSGFRVYGINSIGKNDYRTAADRLLRRWDRPDITARIMNRDIGMKFADMSHEIRFREAIKDISYGRFKFMATVFLLSADEDLWNRSAGALNGSAVDFTKIRLRNISIEGYTLYKAAKTIYTGTAEITDEEIFDDKLVNDPLLHIIFNGFIIAENGIKILI